MSDQKIDGQFQMVIQGSANVAAKADRNGACPRVRVALLLASALTATAAACGGGSGGAAQPAQGADAGDGDQFASETGADAPGATDGDSDADADADAAEGHTNAADAQVNAESSSDSGLLATVSGHVVAFPTFGLFPATDAQVISGRRVTLLDAMRRKTEVVTDASGAFQVNGVTPPYDAFVDGPSGAPQANSVPIAFLSIDTLHPRLVAQADPADGGALAPDASGSPSWKQGILNVPLQLPTCPSAYCNVELELTDHSSGASLGSLAGEYDSQHTSYTQPASAQWYSASATTNVDVYVIAFDESALTYWYGSYAGGVLVRDQATTQVPETVTPAAVSDIGMFTLTVSTGDVPVAWGAPSLDVFLAFAGTQGSIPLAQVNSTSVAIGVPDLLGATLQVQASTQDPNQSDPRAWAGAMASTLPLTTGSEALTLAAPPTVTSPAFGASISASQGALSWTGASKAQVILAEIFPEPDGGASAAPAYLFTSGDSIDLGRLSAMGVPLADGPSILLLDGIGKVASLDAILDESTLAVPDYSESSAVQWHFTVIQ